MLIKLNTSVNFYLNPIMFTMYKDSIHMYKLCVFIIIRWYYVCVWGRMTCLVFRSLEKNWMNVVKTHKNIVVNQQPFVLFVSQEKNRVKQSRIFNGAEFFTFCSFTYSFTYFYIIYVSSWLLMLFNNFYWLCNTHAYTKLVGNFVPKAIRLNYIQFNPSKLAHFHR